jgi:hypothetical protein
MFIVCLYTTQLYKTHHKHCKNFNTIYNQVLKHMFVILDYRTRRVCYTR